jgi:membrane-associated phospholipid phosphatase
MSKQHIVIATCIAAALIVSSMLFVDVPLARFIHALETPWLRSAGHVLEELGKSHWVLIYCLVTIAIAWHFVREVAHRHIEFFLSVAISGILANIIKVIACRPRPMLMLTEGITQWDFLAFRMEYLWNSFPSGHATTGLAIAISGSAAWPKLRWLFWPLGIAIAVARMIVDAHYLSDVIAGSALGAVVAVTLRSARVMTRR